MHHANFHAFKSEMCVRNMDAASVSLSLPVYKEADARVFVCLPCYNEAENIPQLLRQIHSTLKFLLLPDALDQQSFGIEGYQILAVDDGSTDGTEELLKNHARTYPLTVIRHSCNQGLAETYRTLINALKKQADNNDIAVFMDADNTHSPKVITELVRVASTRADVVVASRYNGGTEVGVPLKRRILSRVVNWLIRNICGISVLDCTCGYRAYRLEVLKKLPPLESKGFEVSAEVLIGISCHNPPYKIEEIPLKLHYDRKKGSSKIHLGQTIKAYAKLLWKHRKRTLRSANPNRKKWSEWDDLAKVEMSPLEPLQPSFFPFHSMTPSKYFAMPLHLSLKKLIECLN